VYVPAAWLAPTFKVAPTLTVCVPADKVPVDEGVLVKVSTVIELPPLESVSADEGSVME